MLWPWMLQSEAQPSQIVWWKIAAVWCRWQKGTEMVPHLVGGGLYPAGGCPYSNSLLKVSEMEKGRSAAVW